MRISNYVLAAATAFASTQAFAIFDAQVLVGKRTGETENTSTKEKTDWDGTDVQAAFHIDPIPLVPVAFGLYASQQTYDFDKGDFKKVTGLEAGVQVYAWFPLGIAGLKPYAKLGYPLFSALKADTDFVETTTNTTYEISSVLKVSGPHIGIGLSYGIPVLPIALLLEVDMGRQTMKPDEVKIEPALASFTASKDEFDYNSTAILFGVQAGL
jgi:hypothetical protein